LVSISVVIPVYKNYASALDSILSCDVAGIDELVVVDDTPSDLRKCLNVPRFEHIKEYKFIANKRNRGVTFSRNRGYFCASGDIVIFLDSDDQLVSDSVESVRFSAIKYLDAFCFLYRSEGVSYGATSFEGECREWFHLLRRSNSGERTVVVRKCGFKPFKGALRGHELRGLVSYCKKSGGKCIWLPDKLRSYSVNVPGGLSSLRTTKERARLISIGHMSLAKFLCVEGKYRLSVVYLLKCFRYLYAYLVSRS
jgi:glycosyltransferase involved in cell wall biosynthesis